MTGEILKTGTGSASGAQAAAAAPALEKTAASAEETARAAALFEASRRLGEPEWLGRWRQQACVAEAATPLPARADHLWRYTDPALFVPETAPAAGELGTGPAVAGGARQGTAHEGSARHGSEPQGSGHQGSAREGTAPRGVFLGDLPAALETRSEALREVFGRLVGPDFGKFEALNGAFFSAGTFLHVPKGLALEQPVHLRSVVERAGFQAGRLAVLVEAGASLTLIDEWSGGPESGEARLFDVVEIVAGADSRVHFVTVQNLSPRVKAHLTHRARLGRGARFVPVLASFGGALTKCDTGAVLEGEGSESEMTGFLSAVGRQRFDHHTLHHHLGAHTRSNLDFKTVLDGRARSAYTGLIRIEPQARYSEAYQENRNLLLSSTCRADTIPELEILTEEVQCKHGATVGPLDPVQLFYLRSRAIPEAEAVRMIVEGHFESALQRLPEELQARLREILRARLKEI